MKMTFITNGNRMAVRRLSNFLSSPFSSFSSFSSSSSSSSSSFSSSGIFKKSKSFSNIGDTNDTATFGFGSDLSQKYDIPPIGESYRVCIPGAFPTEEKHHDSHHASRHARNDSNEKKANRKKFLSKEVLIPNEILHESHDHTEYDAIVIGGGHNGMITAHYLAKEGLNTIVLERRGITGGCCVTEESVEGFKFSRGAYLAGLLRQSVVDELRLKELGLELIPRDPGSVTPYLSGDIPGKPDLEGALILGDDRDANWESIARLSQADADAFAEYEDYIGWVRDIINPLIDVPPVDFFTGTWSERIDAARALLESGKVALSDCAPRKARGLTSVFSFMTGSSAQLLDSWFENDLLKATLATDSIIGAWHSPYDVGSAYQLLHHCMGEGGGWSYARGGMGSVTDAIRRAAESQGVSFAVNVMVKEILVDEAKGMVRGVRLIDGTKLTSKIVVSATNPYHTFVELIDPKRIAGLHCSELERAVAYIRDAPYGSGSAKINLALSDKPDLPVDPHGATVHFVHSMRDIDASYRARAQNGVPPIVEMVVPTNVDSTLTADPNTHIAQIYCQYADPRLELWEDLEFKRAFEDSALSVVERVAPGFRDSVIGMDSLSPLDLQRVFGIPFGNFSHFPMSLPNLMWGRPHNTLSGHRVPGIQGLYIGSAGNHPGGGVIGAPGRNCAASVLGDIGTTRNK